MCPGLVAESGLLESPDLEINHMTHQTKTGETRQLGLWLSNEMCPGLVAKSGLLESPDLEINLMTHDTRQNTTLPITQGIRMFRPQDDSPTR